MSMLPAWLYPPHDPRSPEAKERKAVASERRRLAAEIRAAKTRRGVSSADAVWYAACKVNTWGRFATPVCARYCRRDYQWQFDSTIELAHDFIVGAANIRTEGRSYIGEYYWLWHRAGEDHPEFWMVPFRIQQRVLLLSQLAHDTAAAWAKSRGESQYNTIDLGRVLQAWRKSGTWRKHVQKAFPQRPEQSPALTAAKASPSARKRANRLPI